MKKQFTLEEYENVKKRAYEHGRHDAAKDVSRLEPNQKTYSMAYGPSVFLWDAIRAARGEV